MTTKHLRISFAEDISENFKVITYNDILDIEKSITENGIVLLCKTLNKEEQYIRLEKDKEQVVSTILDLWKNNDTISTTTALIPENRDSLLLSTTPTIITTDSAPTSVTISTAHNSTQTYAAPSPVNQKSTLPAFLSPLLEQVDCECKEHLDRIEIAEEISANASQVFESLFGDHANDFWDPLDKAKGITSTIS